jgi:hypothetical protein
MELKIDISYNQILKLIKQLPKKDIERLSITLQSEIESGQSTEFLQKMILDAPTWTEAEFREYNAARG